MKQLETIVSEKRNRWKYDVLYSCPYVIILGKSRINGFDCIATLPVLNHRVNILIGKKSDLVVHNIPSNFPYRDLVMDACMLFVGEKKCNEEKLCKILRYTFYYGGYIVFIRIGETIYPLNIEVVNTDKLAFYYKPVKEKNVPEYEYGFLTLLGIAFRIGNIDLVKNVCNEPNCRYHNQYLVLNTLNGELVISYKKKPISLQGYYYVVPDNNPARNVVKVN